MRILLAKLLVAVTALLIVVLAVVFPTLRRMPDQVETPSVTPFHPPESAAMDRGRAVFIEQRCQRCHSFHGEGNKRSPLDGVGSRLSEKDIRLWITAPQTMKPGIAKRAYKLSAGDLDALVAYLMEENPVKH